MARISVDRTMAKPQDFASDGTEAVGFTHFWGNSPALDLLQDEQATAFGPLAIGTSPSGIYKDEEKCDNGTNSKETNRVYDADEGGDGGESDGEPVGVIVEDVAPPEPVAEPLPVDVDSPINVLIVGGADIRHVLKTVSRRRRALPAGQKLRFFLHESKHEVLARHLLFLQIINNTLLPVRERAEMFLSLYGNTLVRERDSRYVEEIATELIELITDNSEHPLVNVVDLTHLKYRDRDILQDVVKGWMKDVPFDVEALREQRCRGYYRERYDFRKNLMDYDYQTHIKPKAGIINWFHYKEFCHTGVAFETRLASYNTPNRTVASYTDATDKAKGTSVQVRGFWGDIINSPYHSFSTATDPADRPRLFKISGSQYRHTETDVAEFNVIAYITEMDSGHSYHLPPERPEEHQFPFASPLEDIRKEDSVAELGENCEGGGAIASNAGLDGKRTRGRRAEKRHWPALSDAFQNVEVVFLSGAVSDTLKKPKYGRLFHRAFVGSMAVLPIFEEMSLLNGGDVAFRPAAGAKVRKAPRLQAPEMFGKLQNDLTIAGVMAPGAEVVFESLKYQAHFDGISRVGFRHRLAQLCHLAGWMPIDEKHAVPRLEQDLKERRANELEKDATDFVRFVTSPP